MRLVEIRDLDGPNIYLPGPAIKIEIATDDADREGDGLAALAARLEPFGLSEEEQPSGLAAIGRLLVDLAVALHQRAEQPKPETSWAEMETAGHLAVAFAWERRRFALALARLVADVATGDASDPATKAAGLPALLLPDEPDDRPRFVRDDQRAVPIVGVTGTNGKTTTTRLIAHVLRGTGRRVGWTTTAGVYIDGEMVLEGDYTGPAGAHRVLDEPGIEMAVLETARGGILLRGLAYESNDVGVLTNISGDHLGLHGIYTVEGLAEVKATVVRATRSSGYAVLNADDPRVRGLASTVRAPLFLVSQDAQNPALRAHVDAGGRALFVRDGTMIEAHGAVEEPLLGVTELPITFGGRARHMIENGLCAAAACLGLGIERSAVVAGLRSFGRNPDDNPGRLHVYDRDGVIVIVDYAHNEVGLSFLLELAESYRGEGGRLTPIIGTAGDRTDDALRELGRLAGEHGDRVLIKETTRYLRGRASAAEMNDRFVEGIAAAGETPYEIFPDEPTALDAALAGAKAGDVVAMMCIEEGPAIRTRLSQPA